MQVASTIYPAPAVTVLHWGTATVSVSASPLCAVVFNQPGEVTDQKWVSGVRDTLRGWDKDRDSIQEEVEALLLRHIVPGRCKLCPQ